MSLFNRNKKMNWRYWEKDIYLFVCLSGPWKDGRRGDGGKLIAGSYFRNRLAPIN